MKKTIITLSMVFAVSLFIASCKSKPAETPVTNTIETVTNKVEEVKTETQETANEVVDGLTVPTFSDPAVNEFCGEFKTIMKEYATAKGSGDAAKEKELEAKVTAWGKKVKTITGKLKPEEVEGFNNFIKNAANSFHDMSTAATNKK